MNKAKLEKLERVLGVDEFSFPTFSPAGLEELEEAKTTAIHAMLLAAVELESVVDPDDTDGIGRALRQWVSSSITDFPGAVALVQELLSLPESEQAAIRRPRAEDGIDDEDDEDREDDAESCVRDRRDCCCPECARLRLAVNGDGDDVENRGPPPGGWATPAGNYPGAF